MMSNRKGAIGTTLTWMVATLIIVFVMAAFTILALVLGKFSSKPDIELGGWKGSGESNFIELSLILNSRVLDGEGGLVEVDDKEGVLVRDLVYRLCELRVNKAFAESSERGVEIKKTRQILYKHFYDILSREERHFLFRVMEDDKDKGDCFFELGDLEGGGWQREERSRMNIFVDLNKHVFYIKDKRFIIGFASLKK